jgi:hypothetical protein
VQEPPEHERERSRRPPEAQPTTGEPAPSPQYTRIIDLQRTSGNAAVSRLVQRGLGPAQPAPVLARQPPPVVAPAAAATIAQLDEALDHFNVNEGHVIDLLGRLSAPDKARVLTGGYGTRLASAFNTSEMVRAVSALHAPLWQALEWVKAAAGTWSDIDYPDVKSLVVAAPQPERDALKTRPWRDRFVGICSNATMVDAVIDLHFDLRTKLDWTIEEGMNTQQAATVVRSAPAAELAPTLADTALMALLRDELSSGGYAQIVKMLQFGLLGEGDIERNYVGNEYHTWTALYRTGLTFFKRVQYNFDAGVSAADQARFRLEVQEGVNRHMNGHWKLRIASVGTPQEGDGDYPIRFDVTEGTTGAYPIAVHAGNGRCATGEDGGEWYVDSMVGDSPDQRRAYFAHELGHGILGAPEEYPVDPGSTHDPGRTVTHDQSVMGNFYEEADVTKVEIKDRHLTFLTTWAAQFFPGRRISVVR